MRWLLPSAAHIYLRTLHAVLSSMPHDGVRSFLSSHRTGAMQDPVYELPRRPILRRWVNKPTGSDGTTSGPTAGDARTSCTTIYVLICLMSLAHMVFNPTVWGGLPSVGVGGGLAPGNGLSIGTFSVVGTAGPALGGLVVATVGVDAA